MEKKHILGSVFVTLLMLMTTIATIITIADPSMHTGDAWVGELWITELDVSGELNNVDNIGVGHVTADDDWVLWTGGEGNIKANWTVDIDATSHPEYCIMFSLVAINVDDDNTEMDNHTIMKTYVEDRTYDESGSLTLSIAFSQEFMNSNDEATLVCYLNTYVRINDTNEATNFSICSMDRCVVGVSFDSECGEEPFSRFTTEANTDFPNIWSWLYGWNENNRFTNEADMLETHTFVKVGKSTSSGGSGWNWDLGNLDVDVYMLGRTVFDFTHQGLELITEWDQNEEIDVNSYIDYDITDHNAFFDDVWIRYRLTLESARSFGTKPKQYDGSGTIGRSFTVVKSDDLLSNDYIYVTGKVWALRAYNPKYYTLSRGIDITGDEGTSSSLVEEDNCYWEDSVAYYNESYNVDASNSTSLGITTVDIDISDVLQYSEECVHIYAGDVGDERVVLSV